MDICSCEVTFTINNIKRIKRGNDLVDLVFSWPFADLSTTGQTVRKTATDRENDADRQTDNKYEQANRDM